MADKPPIWVRLPEPDELPPYPYEHHIIAQRVDAVLFKQKWIEGCQAYWKMLFERRNDG